jgi:dsRNA-specific ribonuclease
LLEFAVDGLRCGVGSARSKKEAKEQAAALALRALAREPPRDL